jgi:predicted nucleic acid-binding protein
MADCIVDTSVALKWVLVEADSVLAERVSNDVLTSGGTLHLLDLARIEALNAIWLQFHRRLAPEAIVRIAVAKLYQSPIQIMDSTPLLGSAFDLALQYDIAVYDACFVAAVKQMGCAGVTADAPLVKRIGAAFPAIKLLKNW